MQGLFDSVVPDRNDRTFRAFNMFNVFVYSPTYLLTYLFNISCKLTFPPLFLEVCSNIIFRDGDIQIISKHDFTCLWLNMKPFKKQLI